MKPPKIPAPSIHMACLLAAATLLVACMSRDRGPSLRQGSSLALELILPHDSGPGLRRAGQDLLGAMAAITGVGVVPAPILGELKDASLKTVIQALRREAERARLGEQGYAIERGELGEGVKGLRVVAATDQGLMYGLYKIAKDLGIHYFHPEETFYPSDEEARLPWRYDGSAERPRFEVRGFHEHTQHPIVMSDFLMRPGNPAFRAHLSNYLLWMARNRQNFLSFHLLKTIPLQSWLPYMAGVVREAKQYGIRMGGFVSFEDQQQNGFKMIREDRIDPATGQMMAPGKQIRDTLDTVLSTGFEFVGLQFGTSEFTMGDENLTLAHFQTAVDHVRANHPGVRLYAWIHTTCSLKTDDGGYFYHLPAKADPDVGAFVHTTMFHTLGHPAPVYYCENFHQQVDFLKQTDGQRELVYFPETAWWLGFDNNMPLVLPITGFSREYDIRVALAPYKVSGHVTFTTGREWTYWMYDHYLTRATWKGDTSWEDYLEALAPLYGELGPYVVEALKAWTRLQVKHFYQDNPLIYFYLAGELPLDEIGERAGVLARRPKLSYKTVLGYNDEELAAWKVKDYDMLGAMLAEYRAVLGALPASLARGTAQQQKLHDELYRALKVFVRRIEHVRALYAGVVAARDWHREQRRALTAEPPEVPSAAIRADALGRARQHLARARAITAEMTRLFSDMESSYRHPLDLLTREKPESLTVYPFGYLFHTSTAYFWTRRDEQLDILIGSVFQTLTESWTAKPDSLFFTEEEKITLTVPDNDFARNVIVSFVPRLLFGLTDYDPAGGTMTVTLARDGNDNFLPDGSSEDRMAGTLQGNTWTGSSLGFTLPVKDSTGLEVGQLTLVNPDYTLTLVPEGQAVGAITGGVLDGQIQAEELVGLVVSMGGIDRDGVEVLVKSIFGVNTDDPLPAHFPIRFKFEFEKAW